MAMSTLPSAVPRPPRDKSGRFTGITVKPRGCGRLQRAIRRTFIAYGFRPLITRAFLLRCYPGARRHVPWMRRGIIQILRRDYRELGRQAHMQGRAILWGPK
jgi:hypothetical protein